MAAADQFGPERGINTYAYSQSHTAADVLRHLADRGVTAVELMCFPGHLWVTDSPATLAEVRRILDANKMVLRCLNAPNIDLNVAGASAEMREFTLDMNRGFLRLAEAVGAEGMILGPGKANPLFPLPTEVLDGHFLRALDILVPLAEAAGRRIFVENMPFAYLPEARQVVDRLERHGNPWTQICYDIANGHFIGKDPAEELALVAPRLGLVHLSDTPRDRFEHSALGTGTVDLAPLPAALAASGYAKEVILEIISANPDADIATSIRAMERHGL